MQVFDFQIPDKELETTLEKIYQAELGILRYEFEFHCQEPRKRLALATVSLQTHDGVVTLGILIKESSKYELTILSLMNKLLPYSCPRLICYTESPSAMWILMENITTWVNIDGDHRVNETLVDGLYTIQAAFLDNTQTLLDDFKTIPIITKDVLLRAGYSSLTQINELSTNELFAETFGSYEWNRMKRSIEKILEGMKDCSFSLTLIHGNYYPNTARAMRDDQGRLHVVAYDWQNAAVGWPQVDLVILLDRLDILAKDRGLPGPSPVLFQGYLSRLIDEFDIDPEMFYKVYKICYVCRMLPLMRWWMRGHMQDPLRDPGRVFLEIRSKLDVISSWQSIQSPG